jgi:hypothetical protein
VSDNTEGLDRAERKALSDALGDGPDKRTEYAVVYYQRGGPAVTGPLPWHAAESQAANRRGIIVERIATTTYGPWSAVPE